MSTTPPIYPWFLNLAKCRSSAVTLLMFETTLNPEQTNGQNPQIGFDCNCARYPDSGPADLGDRHPHQKGTLGGNLMMLDGHIEWTDHLYDVTVGKVPLATSQTWWPY